MIKCRMVVIQWSVNVCLEVYLKEKQKNQNQNKSNYDRFNPERRPSVRF